MSSADAAQFCVFYVISHLKRELLYPAIWKGIDVKSGRIWFGGLSLLLFCCRDNVKNRAVKCIKIRPPRPTWSLTPHPPAGPFAHKDMASPLLRLSGTLARQDLPLSRTMLTGIFPAYVDRFACDWHRLSTTDAREPHIHYTAIPAGRQVRFNAPAAVSTPSLLDFPRDNSESARDNLEG